MVIPISTINYLIKLVEKECEKDNQLRKSIEEIYGN